MALCTKHVITRHVHTHTHPSIFFIFPLVRTAPQHGCTCQQGRGSRILHLSAWLSDDAAQESVIPHLLKRHFHQIKT